MGAKVKGRLLKYSVFRRIVQFCALIFFVGVIFNPRIILPILLPVMWTWGLPNATVGDAFTALQLMLGGWSLGSSVVFPWLAIASFLIFGILVGKSLCGWVCPFGLIQDIVGFIKSRKLEISPATHGGLTRLKYLILGIALLVSSTFSASKYLNLHGSYERAFGIFAYAPFTVLSPAETLFSVLPKSLHGFYLTFIEKSFVEALSGILYLPPLFWLQVLILIGTIMLAAYVQRGWCRYFCPHGAIMAFMNRFSFIGLHRDPVKCAKGECRECVKACPMKVRILDLPWKKFSDPECIYCMKCADVCPNGAIRPTYP